MTSEAVLRRPSMCLACGDEMAECLAGAGSLRCHDCRETNAPLQAHLVEPPLQLSRRRQPDTESDLRIAA